ncbi:ABC transporter permease [Sphingobium sufflavum]|uniref:ABC transporter permease n=1 Tax=Sphingobium sufflavum TaxID=1129547 RepID=UPI001F461EB5|nr:ABC transporter permease [Sphingobium sufflavum]MCE7795659.1 ABC transporter permease [Sphingobium sufflavum]
MRRLRAMIVKEMWAALRDPKQRLILIMPALMQLFIFSYATTLDVTHVDIGVLDRSGGVHASELLNRVAGSPTFRSVVRLESPAALRTAIDDQRVIAAIVIDPDFDRLVDAGRPASIGMVLDGRKSNAAQIVSAYVSRIAGGMGADLSPRAAAMMGEGTVVTHWYNPSLDFVWFTLPSLIAIITMIGAIAVMSQSVARERELGTFDQLMVSPLRIHEIVIGKVVPPFVIGLFNATLFLILAPLVFGVPFTGSLILFYLGLIFYTLALVGIGLFVSVLCGTQQQAFLGSFLITMPLIMLSGYASPIENMPGWLQIVSLGDPVRYFLVIVQGVFLKAMPAGAVFHQLWPLILIATVTLGASAWLFRARME